MCVCYGKREHGEGKEMSKVFMPKIISMKMDRGEVGGGGCLGRD